MKRLPLLLLALTLAGHAIAMDSALPEASDSAVTSASAIDLRGLALALVFSSTDADFKICQGSAPYAEDLQGVVQDDLRGFSLGSEAYLAESTAFTAEDRAAAVLLRGFIDPAREGLAKDVGSAHEAVMEVLQKALGDTKDPKRMEAVRGESADLRARLAAGQLVAPPDVLHTACLATALLASTKHRGPMIDRYRSYLQERIAEYTTYRSSEGYMAARWGMTPTEVAQAEDLPVTALRSGKVVRIDGSSAKASYQFTDGRLSEVIVTFIPPCKAAACLNRYRSVNSLLVEKYGTGEDYSSTDDQALREGASMLFEGLGRERYPWLLLEHGYRKEEHAWQTSESAVIHQLFSLKKPLEKGSTDLVHNIRYISKRFLPRAEYLRRLKEQADKKKRLESL